MIQRHTSLTPNVIVFCRYLRANGFGIGPEEESLALKALVHIDLGMREEFRLALRATLVRNLGQAEKFDRLFLDYWKELEKALDSKIAQDPNPKPNPALQQPSFQSLKSWLFGNQHEEETDMATYSVQESLAAKDFSMITTEELDEMRQRIKELSKTLAISLNRRQQRTRMKRRFDMRQTLRKNMRRGGELLEIAFQKPKKNRLKLVIICDVSQSMDLYSSFFIQFMYAFQLVYKRIETFVFSTQLQRITQALRSKPFKEAMQDLQQNAKGWSGGTKIGECLQDFVQNYAFPHLNKQTIVLILSDGWDTGNAELIEENMVIIQQKSRKVLWLNPLMGNPNFKPEVEGMKAALPYLNGLASVHNLESLRKIKQWL